jgi:predicted dehydrogenase
MRRVGFVGLQTTHAFSDARSIAEMLPGVEVAFVDRDAERCSRFAAEWPHARRFQTIDEILDWGPSGLIVTERPAVTASAVQRALVRGIPTFANKPAAISVGQLADLERAVARAPGRFLTTSVLRFATATSKLDLDPSSMSTAQITVRHDVAWWSSPASRWQDDPREGGGIVAAMGVHAFDLAAAIFGPRFSVVAAERSLRSDRDLVADHARIEIVWGEGARADIELAGGEGEEHYSVMVDGRAVLSLPEATSDPLGYGGTIRQFMAMMRGAPSPVGWPEMRAVLAAVADATALAGRAAS